MNPVESAPVSSLEIELTSPESSIWKGFTASTRNQVNRAIREGMVFQCWSQPDKAVIDEFFSFHRQFATERGFGTVDPEWMREYSAQHALTLTRASTSAGKVLVWHSYYRNQRWVCQIQSVSLFASQEHKESRNATARANRFLHWMDILEFQKSSTAHFDFGGWYSGDRDEKLLRVNAFKEEFGGVKTQRYASTIAVTFKGKLFLQARKFLRRRPAQLHWV